MLDNIGQEEYRVYSIFMANYACVRQAREGQGDDSRSLQTTSTRASSDGATSREGGRARSAGASCWKSSVRPDGADVTPLIAVWLDGRSTSHGRGSARRATSRRTRTLC